MVTRNATRDAFALGDRIVVVNENEWRTVRGLAPQRMRDALTALGNKPSIGAYEKAFAPLCDAQPLPGWQGKPGLLQARAILRHFARKGVLAVTARAPVARKPSKAKVAGDCDWFAVASLPESTVADCDAAIAAIDTALVTE